MTNSLPLLLPLPLLAVARRAISRRRNRSYRSYRRHLSRTAITAE